MKPYRYLSVFLLFWLTYSINANSDVIVPLKYRISDAEYSKSLNRIISISANPSKLHNYNPDINIDTYINLPLTPSSVSVSPNGLFAAVGHNGYVSYIDLQNMKLVKTIPVTTDVLDIVLADNGFAYAFPRADQWVGIHSIDINAGKEVSSNDWGIYAGTVAKLHPSGKSMYGADNGLSPSDIAKYGIDDTGIATVLYDSPYHGDFAMCGDLWISEDGKRVFTKCGNVFRSSDIRAEDMTYNGKLSNTNYVRFLTNSSKAKKVVVIPDITWYSTNKDEDTVIQIYNYEYLSLKETKTLPNFKINTKSYAAHGRFVFYNSDASKFFVIVQADENSGLLNDFGIISYSTGITPCSINTVNADCDNDGVLNKDDNCVFIPNKAKRHVQLDTDLDHYGNVCDPDLNNDNIVNADDFKQWLGNSADTSGWLSICGNPLYIQSSDFNGDCKIDKLDSDILIEFLFKKPGPSCFDLPQEMRGSKC